MALSFPPPSNFASCPRTRAPSPESSRFSPVSPSSFSPRRSNSDRTCPFCFRYVIAVNSFPSVSRIRNRRTATTVRCYLYGWKVMIKPFPLPFSPIYLSILFLSRIPVRRVVGPRLAVTLFATGLIPSTERKIRQSLPIYRGTKSFSLRLSDTRATHRETQSPIHTHIYIYIHTCSIRCSSFVRRQRDSYFSIFRSAVGTPAVRMYRTPYGEVFFFSFFFSFFICKLT